MSALVRFFLLAFVITWTFWAPKWLPFFGIQVGSDHFILDCLAGMGPSLAAIIVTLQEGRMKGALAFAGRVLQPRSLTHVSLSIAFPAGCLALALMAAPGSNRIASGEVSWPKLLQLGVCYGFGEEFGWRGFALPRLQRRHYALSSSLILFPIWVLWHWPVLVDANANSGVISHLAGFSTFLVGSIFLTWLFNSSRGSVVAAACFHGVYDVASSTSKLAQIFIVLIMFAWVVAVIIIYKPEHLSRRARTIA